jgi:hypothetical protein
MRRSLRRGVVAALLGLMAVAAATGVAKAVAQLQHACCERAADAAASADAQPCHGFLPLSCCQAAALPAHESTSPPPLALPCAIARVDAVALRAHAAPRATPASRASPPRLSVVLQV